jgi:hypothetical protein
MCPSHPIKIFLFDLKQQSNKHDKKKNDKGEELKLNQVLIEQDAVLVSNFTSVCIKYELDCAKIKSLIQFQFFLNLTHRTQISLSTVSTCSKIAPIPKTGKTSSTLSTFTKSLVPLSARNSPHLTLINKLFN